MAGPTEYQRLFSRLRPELLFQLLESHGIKLSIDRDTLPHKRPGPRIFKAWSNVPEAKRAPVEVVLHEVSSLSTERGVLGAVQAAKWFGQPIDEVINQYEGNAMKRTHKSAPQRAL
jgi:hypothetical protein